MIAVLFSPIHVEAQTAEAVTVGSLIGKLALMDDFLSGQLGSVKGDIHDVMADARDKFRSTRVEIEESYKYHLDYTLSSLDKASGLKLVEFDGKLNTWLQSLSTSIASGAQVSKQVLLDARFTSDRLIEGLNQVRSDFVFDGARLVNLATVAVVKTVTLISCILFLLFFVLTAARSSRHRRGALIGALFSITVAGIVGFTPIANRVVASELESDPTVKIASLAPDEFVVGQTRPLFIVGQNFADMPDGKNLIVGPMIFTPKSQTSYMITGQLAIPDSVPPGAYPILALGSADKASAPRSVKVVFPEERTVLAMTLKAVGSHTQIDRREDNYHIEAFSAWGQDDGVTKEDTLSPPQGYRLVDFRDRYHVTLGPSDRVHTTERVNNGVRYKLTAVHGPWHNRERNLTNLDITLISEADKTVPSEGPVVSLMQTPVVIKRGQSEKIADILNVAKGDVQTVDTYVLTIKVRHPDGDVSDGAWTFRSSADGTSEEYGGVRIARRGDSIFIDF
jgi:hypothetical protein